MLPWRESSAITLQLMIRQNYSRFERADERYHDLVIPLLLEAGELGSVGHFAGLLAAKRRAAHSVCIRAFHRVRFGCYRFGEVPKTSLFGLR
jgi:hypothetical protein